MLYGDKIQCDHPEPRVEVKHDPEGDDNIRIDKVDLFRWLDELTTQKTIDWAEANGNMSRSQAFRAPAMLAQGLMPDTVDLYMLLERRAYTKLFPGAWPRGNTSFFEHNFFAGEEALLRGHGKPDHHAEFAFRDLLKMAGKARSVRARPTCRARRSEALTAQHVRAYIRWSHRDADVTNLIREQKLVPLLSVVAGHKGMDIGQLEQRTLRALKEKSRKVLELIRKPEVKNRADFGRDESYIMALPTVWGLVVLQEVAAIVAYQPLSAGKDKLLPIAFFHLRNALYTEWNTVAIALLIVHCRQRLLEMAAALRL